MLNQIYCAALVAILNYPYSPYDTQLARLLERKSNYILPDGYFNESENFYSGWIHLEDYRFNYPNAELPSSLCSQTEKRNLMFVEPSAVV